MDASRLRLVTSRRLKDSLQQEHHLVDEPVGVAVLEQEAVVVEHATHVPAVLITHVPGVSSLVRR